MLATESLGSLQSKGHDLTQVATEELISHRISIIQVLQTLANTPELRERPNIERIGTVFVDGHQLTLPLKTGTSFEHLIDVHQHF